jgi:hypothetical protein
MRVTSYLKYGMLIALLGACSLPGLSEPLVGVLPAIKSGAFHVPAEDRVRNRVGLLDGLMFIGFLKADVLNPEGGASATLPDGAIIRAGALPVQTYTSPGLKRYCNNSLADDIRHNYEAGYKPFFEDAMDPIPKDLARFQFFVATDKSWVAQCFPEAGSCTTLFANGRWAARINISQKDLCNAPRMNRRLVAIADKWIK